MLRKLNEKVEVIASFDKTLPEMQCHMQIHKVRWSGRVYKIVKFGHHHLSKQGLVIHHIFSVCSESLFFKLDLDTKNMIWTVEEVSDAAPYQSS